jgi:hypothetical protein
MHNGSITFLHLAFSYVSTIKTVLNQSDTKKPHVSVKETGVRRKESDIVSHLYREAGKGSKRFNLRERRGRGSGRGRGRGREGGREEPGKTLAGAPCVKVPVRSGRKKHHRGHYTPIAQTR